ncbi:SUKH-3 domain-containing protein [Streptomyces sp. NBC_00572]|uniref:SUKH-3 domain-containing protein n=1 Tax=Streptomyces sp. NBC_00572 TaxID=2903664 RepID=UPI00224FD759|nr:SUKH-3 domain-containing protein [Streptomyces sp. NBC_00572]MCX4984181.1 SUKH-3 domain-containing protein [Streptomyces sp. NBC_00572]
MTGVLTEAGWRPGRDTGDAAMLAVLITVTVGAELFPAAERALREFHGLHIHPAADGGREVAAIGSVVDPREARLDVPSLNRLADSLGVRLFPFGRTDTDAPLAVDAHGRLLMLGPGGPWLLGETVHDGLSALATGIAPVRLRAPRWRFPLPGLPADLDAAVRAALVAVFVLHSTGVFSARRVRLRATTLRGIGVVAVDEEFKLGRGSLESNAEPLTEAMTARLDAAGVRAGGCELVLSIPVPSGTEGPPATVECAVTVGSSADGPALTLSAGRSASFDPTAKILDTCAQALADWSGTPTDAAH